MTEPWQILVDPLAPAEPAPALRLPSESTLDDAATALELLLNTDETIKILLLVRGEHPVGRTTRAYLRAALGLSRSSAPGAGDGATLPGESTRFVALKYGCPAGCGTVEYRVLHDDRDRTPCPTCGATLVPSR